MSVLRCKRADADMQFNRHRWQTVSGVKRCARCRKLRNPKAEKKPNA